MKKRFLFLLLVFIFPEATAQINSTAGTVPFGSKINASATPYPFGLIAGNLPAGAYTPASNLYGKSQDAYTAYNSWKTCYAVSCATGSPNQWRIKYDNTTQTVSEGIGYGMLLAAYAADKVFFDGLWAYYKAKSNGNGLMNWQITGCGSAAGNNGATDADLDAAMALLVAECQWPSINSPYDYSAEAATLISKIRQFEIQPTANPPAYQANNGDAWGFTTTCRNPSYQAPAYYKQFQAADAGAAAGFWSTNCVAASYNLISANNDNTTGLITDWSDNNGVTNNCNNVSANGQYGFDACRNPWRMATDYLWNGDANALAVTNPVTNWLKLTAANTVKGPLQQNAANASGGLYHNATFVSTWGLAVMATNSATNQTYLNNMYTETVNVTETQNCSASGGSGYFGNTLRVIALFMQTGNFWKPCPGTAPVELINFDAELSGSRVLLKWSTSSEYNNDHFEVESSSDGQNFHRIGIVKGKGNSSSPENYELTDNYPAMSKNYYRLKQVDFDSRSEYSKVISVHRTGEPDIYVAPNPFSDETTISVSDKNTETFQIRITDLSGRQVYSGNHPVNSSVSVGSGLVSGVYLIQILAGDRISYSRIVKN